MDRLLGPAASRAAPCDSSCVVGGADQGEGEPCHEWTWRERGKLLHEIVSPPQANQNNIGRADFVSLGEATGVRPRALERALDELRERVDLWIDGIDELPFDGGVLGELRRAVEYRREQLR